MRNLEKFRTGIRNNPSKKAAASLAAFDAGVKTAAEEGKDVNNIPLLTAILDTVEAEAGIEFTVQL